MEGKPDLILGNYTDGNLVASLMARKLGVPLVKHIYEFYFGVDILFKETEPIFLFDLLHDKRVVSK